MALLLRYLLFTFFILISSLCSAEQKTIKLATLDWPPYSGKSLKNGGFTTEIVSKAFALSGYQVEIHYMPWARVLSAVEKGHYDAMFPAYESDERREKYLFSEAFAHSPLVLFQREGLNIQYSNLEDLTDHKIGIVRGYVNTQAFDEANFLNKKIANSDEQNIRKLLKNRIDLAIVDKYFAYYLIEQKQLDREKKLTAITTPVENKPLFLCVSKNIENSTEILDAFQKGLSILQQEGVINNIIHQQFTDFQK
jgi:polar amino acid transport system substrate-binding protein